MATRGETNGTFLTTYFQNLLNKFGSLKGIVNASKKDIAAIRGMGALKADRLDALFNTPFKNES